MSLRLIVKKLELRKNNFITREELNSYCQILKLDYSTTIGYLLANKYLIRILRGIFYVKSIEERKLKKVNIDSLTAIREALKIKCIKNWYFGLETAFKLNHLTHEYFTTDYILNDRIARIKPIEILGRKIKFIKISKKFFGFGVIRDTLPYSDIEKTILDVIYLSKYRAFSDEVIKNKVADLINYCSKRKIEMYAKHYPKTVKSLAKELI